MEETYAVTQSVRRLVRIAAVCGVVLALSGISYGVMLLDTAPPATEEPAPLNPEETVLFYQPVEFQDPSPLAEIPTELDYMAATHYLV